MNSNYFIFADFECGDKIASICQPTQLAAVAIEPRSLEIVGKFSSLIRPYKDEECEKWGLGPVKQEALDITHLTWAELETAPLPKTVWEQFVQFVKSYNKSGNKWAAPILCGYNVLKYDLVIMNRLAGGHRRNLYDEKAVAELVKLCKTKDCTREQIKSLANNVSKLPEPYGFGPWNKENDCLDLFHPRDSIDLMHDCFKFVYENDPNVKSISFDNMRQYFGLESKGAHNAIVDVEQGAAVLIRFIKYFRKHNVTAKFKGSFAQ